MVRSNRNAPFGRIGARGIAAEPPSAKLRSSEREGDGADSPTQACEAREAARPKNVASLRFN